MISAASQRGGKPADSMTQKFANPEHGLLRTGRGSVCDHKPIATDSDSAPRGRGSRHCGCRSTARGERSELNEKLRTAGETDPEIPNTTVRDVNVAGDRGVRTNPDGLSRATTRDPW